MSSSLSTSPPPTRLAPTGTPLVPQRVTLGVIAWILPIATVALMVYFSVRTPVFLTGDNLLAVATQNAPTFIVAIVFSMLLMAGYVDLSVGSQLALVGVASGVALNEWGLVPGVLLGLGIGVAFGAVNGLLIGFLEFSPIVVTLGGLAAGRGLAQYMGEGSIFGFPDPFVNFGSGSFLGVPYLVIVAAVVCFVAVIAMSRLPIGRKIIAIGVNARAAFLVGIRVKPIVFALYLTTGVAVAIAALLQIARLDSAPSGTLGSGFEVTILTAVLLGGVPFDGGRGSLWRVIVGAWLIGVLKNGLTLLNIGTELSGIITGGVLVMAAALEALRHRVHRNQ
ncbi:ABC transporter permease [Streptomyces sp. NBC_01716]|uniref:ABC transporter permease n=1 Tax=Streptomyces sp. NBC_01716 TaxID=2975917 RepID=UPI002E381077|nr:ABC transporter permease [Streptomyces sp. NBC_01716]